MRLRYTLEAREGLRRIEQYIAINLCNGDAAKHIITNILKARSWLKEQPDINTVIHLMRREMIILRRIL